MFIYNSALGGKSILKLRGRVYFRGRGQAPVTLYSKHSPREMEIPKIKQDHRLDH